MASPCNMGITAWTSRRVPRSACVRTSLRVSLKARVTTHLLERNPSLRRIARLRTLGAAIVVAIPRLARPTRSQTLPPHGHHGPLTVLRTVLGRPSKDRRMIARFRGLRSGTEDPSKQREREEISMLDRDLGAEAIDTMWWEKTQVRSILGRRHATCCAPTRMFRRKNASKRT